MIANTSDALVRKRYYMNYFPLTFVLMFFTRDCSVLIPYKEEYFRVATDAPEDSQLTKLSRAEYVALRNEQRQIYSTQTLNKEFMEQSYSVDLIGFKRKKRRVILVAVLAVLMLTCLTVPGALILVLVYEAIFIPMLLLWLPDYKDAKILQQAYDRALAVSPQA